MQDTTAPAATPGHWKILLAVIGASLLPGIHLAAGYLFPAIWEWSFSWLITGVLITAFGLWIASAKHRRFAPAMLAAFSCVLLVELTALFVRDGYLLLRYARPRQVAFNDHDPSWFFYSPAERTVGLSYVAIQRKSTDSAEAKRIFQKAVNAANQIPRDNHILLFLVAEAQVKAGFFEDASMTVRHIRDRFQFELHWGILASEIAQRNGRSQAQTLFTAAIQQAQQNPEQTGRDRDLYLVAYRQWEGGLYEDARRTAELIQSPESKADLLNRVNDSSQMQLAREQAASGHFSDAESTVKQHVKDPYRKCDELMSIAMVAATNAQPEHARRIFGEALQSTQQIDSPGERNSLIADIALHEFELGFETEFQKTLALIDHPAVKGELTRKLASRVR